MKFYIIIIATLFIYSSCSRNTDEYLTGGIYIPNIETSYTNLTDSNNLCYLPKCTIFDDGQYSDDSDSADFTYYSNILRAMKEPVLFAKVDGKETYRFLWLPSFYNPLSIRIEKDCDKYYLYCKLLNEFEPDDSLLINKKKTIDQTIWLKFKELFNDCKFWSKKPMINTELIIDGETWLIEGRDKNYYNVYGTNMPSKQIEVCAKFLIDILKIDSSLLYSIPNPNYKPISDKEYSEIGKVYSNTDEMPKYGKNDSSMYNYFQDNLSYPEYSYKNKIQGTVYVSMIIYEDGSLNNFKIKRGVSPELDSACIRLLKDMPKWSPGKLHGKTVKVLLYVPFKFTID